MASNSGNVHSGHRKRLRDRYIDNGLDGFEEHNVLELLLFYAIPRRDTNDMAHALLNEFGTFSTVLDADIEKIKSVDGIGETAATFLKLIPLLHRRYTYERNSYIGIVNSSYVASEIAIPLFMYEKEELVYLLSFDEHNRCVDKFELYRGEINYQNINAREIYNRAIEYDAHNVVLVHNHFDDNVSVSREDEINTYNLRMQLNIMGLILTDHIIVSGDKYASLVELGYLKKMK